MSAQPHAQQPIHELQPYFGLAEHRYPVTSEELRWARAQLIAGRPLGDVADDLGLLGRELDLHLWAALGSARPAGGFEHISAPLGRVMKQVVQRDPVL